MKQRWHYAVYRLLLICVAILASIWPRVGPATPLRAAPPAEPPRPTPSASPTPEPFGADLTSQSAVVPLALENLPYETEQARARWSMQVALDKYLDPWGPRYQVALIDVKVDGDWARGVARWQGETKPLREPIHILARRMLDASWQALLPGSDELYSQWLDAVPESLISTEERSYLPVEAVEPAAGRVPSRASMHASSEAASPPPSSPGDIVVLSTAVQVLNGDGNYFLKVDLDDPRVRVRTMLANNDAGGYQDLSGIRSRLSGQGYTEWSIINADLFGSGCPSGVNCGQGLTYIEGQHKPNWSAYGETWRVRGNIGFDTSNNPEINVGDSQSKRYMTVAGGPRILIGGGSPTCYGELQSVGDATKTYFPASGEWFDGDVRGWCSDTRPMTAIGYSSDGRYLYMGQSTGGKTVTQLAQWLKDRGAHEVLRFDSGTSSGMYHYDNGNQLFADDSDRAIASALAVVVEGGSGTCSAPSLNTPNDGYVHTSSDRTVNFGWSAPSDCTPDGYTFRVSTSSNMDIIPGLPDRGEGGTSTSNSFGSEWDNTDLYWSVRACKPCTPYTPGPWAPARRLRIEPGSSVSCPQSDGVILYLHANYDCGGQGENVGYVRRTSPGNYDIGSLGLNDQASSIRIPSGWSVRLYRDGGFSGPSGCLNGDDSDFGDNSYDGGGGLNDSVSSFRVYSSLNCGDTSDEGVNLCRNTGYSNCMLFTNDVPSLGNAGFGNDAAESIQMLGDWSAVLFADDNYNGTHSVFNGSDSNLGDNPIGNNQASSMRVRKRNPAYFTLFDLGDWNGASFPSDRTIYDLGHWDFNDRAESIRVASGYEVIVCEHSDFHGVCGRTTHDAGDINSLAQGLRNGASSVRVCAGSCPPAPGTPNPINPADGTVFTPGSSVTFQWTGNSDKYYVELWGGGLSSTQSSGWIEATQWTRSGLATSSNPYYWHVKAWNSYGESGWTAQRSFYVQNQPTPDLSVSAAPDPVTMNAGGYAAVDYTFYESAGTNAHITQRSARFTLLDGETPVSDPIGPYDNDISVPANGSAPWTDYIYLPPEVVTNAQAHGASALLLHTTFSGQDPFGRSVSVQHDLQVNFVTCEDPNEPNDTPGQATPISLGQRRSAYICPSGDYDYYRFSGTAGQRIVIDVDAQGIGSSLDPYIYLLDDDGSTVLAFNDDEPTSLDSKLGYLLPYGGTYYVKVREYDLVEGGNDHFYDLKVFVDDVAPSAQIVSPSHNAWLDHSLETIITDVSDDQSGIRHVRFYWHDADWDNSDWIVLQDDWDPSHGWNYDWDTSSIPEQQGGAVYIYAYDWAGNSAGWGSYGIGMDRTPPTVTTEVQPMYGDAPFLDFWVNWWNSWDNLSGIASYDIQYRDGLAGTWTNLLTNTSDDHYRFVGQNGHTYYFRTRARDYAGNLSTYAGGDGDVQHTVQICTTSADGKEPDNSYTAAKAITTNGTQQSHNFHAAGDQDWLKFTATAGVTYTLVTANTGGHADTILSVYDTNGTTLLAFNDDDPDNWPASRLAWGARRDGTYYVKVEHWDPHAYGCTTAYAVSITETGTFEVSQNVFLPLILNNAP